MQEEAVLRRNKNMVVRIIDNETILLPLYKNSEEINCIYTLNKIASQVWELIDGKRKLGEIKKQVLKKFDASPEEVDKEMKTFLKELKQIKAII